MLFIALVKFKQRLTAEIAAENVKDIEDDERAGIRYHGIYGTLGEYDTVVFFEAPDEKAAMNMAPEACGPDGVQDPRGRAGGCVEPDRADRDRTHPSHLRLSPAATVIAASGSAGGR